MKFLEDKTISCNNVGSLLPQYSWLVLGMSERRHGNLRIGPNGAPIDLFARAEFALEMGIPPERVVAPVLVHGADARAVTSDDLLVTHEVDALVTNEPNLFLSITVADCLPIFFVDGQKKVVGLAHVGWRGLLRGVIERTVLVLQEQGANPTRIRAAIGPSIRACHFEVSLPVAKIFEKKIGADVIARRETKLFVDLQKSAVRLLGRSGISSSNISVSPTCTYDEERLFSRRRDIANGNGVEAMMAVIGILE